MLTPLLIVAAFACQAEDRAAPQEPVFVDVGVLPADGSTDVALDALVWGGNFNGTVRIVGPAGEMPTEVVRAITGSASLEGIRPTAGFEPETRYSILDAFGEGVLGEFTTGTDETSPAPAVPVIGSADQVIADNGRTLRYGIGAFSDAFIFVNPDSTGEDISFAQGVVVTGGPFEIFATPDGEVTTTFVAMNVAGQMSAAVTETHEAPPGCSQVPGEPAALLGLLGLVALRRRRAASVDAG